MMFEVNCLNKLLIVKEIAAPKYMGVPEKDAERDRRRRNAWVKLDRSTIEQAISIGTDEARKKDHDWWFAMESMADQRKLMIQKFHKERDALLASVKQS